jgi:hypothetical protein
VNRPALALRLTLVCGLVLAVAVPAAMTLCREAPPSTADPLASMENRSSAVLSGLLGDASATPEVRVSAGVTLVERDAATPADHAALDGLLGRPGPARRVFIERFATKSRLPGDSHLDRLVVDALADPAGEVRLGAVQALLRGRVESSVDPQACAAVKGLAGDADARLRARAVSLLQVCPAADQPALVQRALEDSDPAVRAAAREREQR